LAWEGSIFVSATNFSISLERAPPLFLRQPSAFCSRGFCLLFCRCLWLLAREGSIFSVSTFSSTL
jgi:hypothetical protein